MSRRVVVTGVGLLTPLGIGTELSWEALLASKSGIAGITAFDATAFSCRIAGEVKGFDPGNYIEKKEIKKMGRFIQFAIAAADFALKDSGLKVTPDIAEEVGVYIGSGIGGFELSAQAGCAFDVCHGNIVGASLNRHVAGDLRNSSRSARKVERHLAIDIGSGNVAVLTGDLDVAGPP